MFNCYKNNLILIIVVLNLISIQFYAQADTGNLTSVTASSIFDNPECEFKNTQIENKFKEKIINIINIKKGDKYSKIVVNQVEENLKISGLFEKVEYKEVKSGNTIKPVFILSLPVYIYDIKLKGNFPFFKTEIYKILTIHSGSIFKPEVLEDQKKRIYDFYLREGYINPVITIKSKKVIRQKLETADIIISINKGKAYTLNNVLIKGNKHFTNSDINWKMSSWINSRFLFFMKNFTEKTLRKDIKILNKYFREKGWFKKGYLDAKISIEKIERNPDNGLVDIILAVKEGYPYKVTFNGNTNISSDDLEDEIVLFNEIGTAKSIIKKQQNIFKELYLDKGFTKIEITNKTMVKEDDGEKYTELLYSFNEGKQTRVKSIKIQGSRKVKKEEIFDAMLTKPEGFLIKGYYNKKVLNDDVDSIRALYFQKGFLNIQVDIESVDFFKDVGFVSIVISVNEGAQTKIGSIEFIGLKNISKDEVSKLFSVKSGDVFNENIIIESSTKIAGIISEKGFPHVKVIPEINENSGKNLVDINIKISEGPKVKRGEIVYMGNFKTREDRLAWEWEMDLKAPFSLLKMAYTQRNIRNMGLFRSVNFKMLGLKEKATTINTVVITEEIEPYSFALDLGYETDTLFNITSELSDINFLGTNRKISLRGKYSGIHKRIETILMDPRFLKYRITANLTPFFEETIEGVDEAEVIARNYGLIFGINKQWTSYFNTSITWLYERRWTVKPEGETRDVLLTSPQFIINTADSYTNPKSGFYNKMWFDISKGLTDELDNFYRIQNEAKFYLTPISYFTIAYIIRAGQVNPYGDAVSIPADRRFFLGGTMSIRGFERDSIIPKIADNTELLTDEKGLSLGGTRTLFSAIELRVPLTSNWELGLFLDAGSVLMDWDDLKISSFRESAGGGIRYHTPIGAIGLLYGYKIDKKPDESSGKIHFSIGYTF